MTAAVLMKSVQAHTDKLSMLYTPVHGAITPRSEVVIQRSHDGNVAERGKTLVKRAEDLRVALL